jgi:hypothetical protein
MGSPADVLRAKYKRVAGPGIRSGSPGMSITNTYVNIYTFIPAAERAPQFVRIKGQTAALCIRDLIQNYNTKCPYAPFSLYTDNNNAHVA